VIIPLRDVVIIEIDKTDETPSGIQLLDSHKDPAGTEIGRVVEYPQRWMNEHGVPFFAAHEVCKGAKVLFARKHGIAVKGHKNLLAVIED
jgi:co-chaperonin GroES (HSP10)